MKEADNGYCDILTTSGKLFSCHICSIEYILLCDQICQRLVKNVLSPIVTLISFVKLSSAITWLNLRIFKLTFMDVSNEIVFILILLQCFRDAINVALAYKNNSTDFMDEIMKELEVNLFKAYLIDFYSGFVSSDYFVVLCVVFCLFILEMCL